MGLQNAVYQAADPLGSWAGPPLQEVTRRAEECGACYCTPKPAHIRWLIAQVAKPREAQTEAATVQISTEQIAFDVDLRHRNNGKSLPPRRVTDGRSTTIPV